MFKLVLQLPPRDLSRAHVELRARSRQNGGGKPMGLNVKKMMLWLALPCGTRVWLHLGHGRVYSEAPDSFFAARDQMHPPREAMINTIVRALAHCPWHRPPSFDK